MARTKTHPMDYYRRLPSTAQLIAEGEKFEALWDESLRKQLPTYEQALQRIATEYQLRVDAINRRWYNRILSPWESWEASRAERNELVALCDQAKAIARALRLNECPAY